jgi:uncharacterized protein YqfA (UPF0365 family)
MRLRQEFLAHDTGSGWVLVPTADAPFSGVVRGNATLGEILLALSSDVAETDIVKRIRERFDAPEGVVERDVNRAIAELRRIGAIVE